MTVIVPWFSDDQLLQGDSIFKESPRKCFSSFAMDLRRKTRTTKLPLLIISMVMVTAMPTGHPATQFGNNMNLNSTPLQILQRYQPLGYKVKASAVMDEYCQASLVKRAGGKQQTCCYCCCCCCILSKNIEATRSVIMVSVTHNPNMLQISRFKQ